MKDKERRTTPIVRRRTVEPKIADPSPLAACERNCRPADADCDLEEYAEEIAIFEGWVWPRCAHGYLIAREMVDEDELRGRAIAAQQAASSGTIEHTFGPSAIHRDPESLVECVIDRIQEAYSECPDSVTCPEDFDDLLDGVDEYQRASSGRYRGPKSIAARLVRRKFDTEDPFSRIRWNAAHHEAGHVVAAWYTGETHLDGVELTSPDSLRRVTPLYIGAVYLSPHADSPAILRWKLTMGLGDPSFDPSIAIESGCSAMLCGAAGLVAEIRAVAEDGTGGGCSTVTSKRLLSLLSRSWSDPCFVLGRLMDDEACEHDYDLMKSYARILFGADGRRVGVELSRAVRRAVRLFWLPAAWRAVKQIALALIAEDELSASTAFEICAAEHVPFAHRRPVPRPLSTVAARPKATAR
jgi:hypothetical protein